MIKVSIILPVYNVEKYLHKCLDTVLNQPLKEIEVICINDGSQDSSLNILREYASKEKRIIIIEQQNQGAGVARNKGLEIARGEYIAFIDPDDWIEKNMLETAYNTAVQYDADIVEFSYKEIFEDSGRVKYHQPKVKLPENKTFDFKVVKTYLFGTNLVPWDRLYKRQLINFHNIRFAEIKKEEDTIFSVSSKIYAQKIVYINKPLYNYLIRTGSLSNSIAPDNIEMMDGLNRVKELLLKEKLYEEYCKEFNKNAIKAIHARYGKIPENLQPLCLELSQKLLEKDYPKLLRALRTDGDKFWERIFSIKNEYVLGCKTHKIITILGWKIKLAK